MNDNMEYWILGGFLFLIILIVAIVVYDSHSGTQFMLECGKIHTPSDCQAMWKAVH